MLGQFPFVIRGFHSGNGSEFNRLAERRDAALHGRPAARAPCWASRS